MSNYGFGHVPLNWDNEHRDLDYHREPFNNQEDNLKWFAQGYPDCIPVTGEMYDMRNLKPEWFDFAKLQNFFDWKELSWSFYKMTTCTILPEHRDTYKRFKELYPEYDPTTIYRAVIFLEDWKPGHVLTIHNKQMHQWQRGDFVWWQDDVKHLAANVGIEDRYTLQLTGFKIESTKL